MKRSAGLLAFRRRDGVLEVFLVHPGGPFWAKKDDGAWTIPKGEIQEGEEPLAAAKREFREETGFEPIGELRDLGSIRQPSGKIVYAWSLANGDLDPAKLTSLAFEMEWPPRSGRQASFPEVDRAAWFSVDVARVKILKGQAPWLDQIA